jgi:hypothetical protein
MASDTLAGITTNLSASWHGQFGGTTSKKKPNDSAEWKRVPLLAISLIKQCWGSPPLGTKLF